MKLGASFLVVAVLAATAIYLILRAFQVNVDDPADAVYYRLSIGAIAIVVAFLAMSAARLLSRLRSSKKTSADVPAQKP